FVTRCALVGPLPTALLALSHLKDLELEYCNQLPRSLPDTLGRLSSPMGLSVLHSPMHLHLLSATGRHSTVIHLFSIGQPLFSRQSTCMCTPNCMPTADPLSRVHQIHSTSSPFPILSPFSPPCRLPSLHSPLSALSPMPACHGPSMQQHRLSWESQRFRSARAGQSAAAHPP
ncbi:unnamed protein product, partial [Closterium sp. Naga37s-1]